MKAVVTICVAACYFLSLYATSSERLRQVSRR